MTTIITADYNGTQVFFQDDAYLNATTIAKHFNKLPNEWLRLDSTQEYIDLLCKKLNTEKSRILKTTRGANGGTWLHRRLAVPFARWLNVEFAIWCDEQIEKILIGENPSTKSISLTKPHQQAIKDLVLGRVKNLPKEQQAGIIIKQWSALKTHFGKSYKDIDDDQFPEAISLLARLPLEGELIIDEPKTNERMLNLNSEGVNAVINCFYSATRMQEAVGCLLTNLRTFRSNTLDSVRFNFEAMDKYIRETQPHVERLVKQRYKPQTPHIGNQKRLTA